MKKPQPKPQPSKDSHQKHVEQAHKAAAKPAGNAGVQFKYPIRVG